eukprot:8821258-Ditylum_brightwellii.AAC.1
MEKLEHAADPMKVIEALERIDTSIDETIATTYSNLRSTPKHWWTEEIHHEALLVRYWSARTSMIQNNTFAIDILTYIHSKLPSEFDIYQGDNQHKPPAQLRKAKKACQNARKDSHTKRQTFLEKQIKKAKKTKYMDK